MYNPTKVDIAVLHAAISAAATAAGWAETSWYETSVDDVGQGVAAQALEAGVDLVIAAGGDGTVRAVAEAVRGSAVLDAKMIENTDDDLKKKAGWVAYLRAIIVSLRDSDELHLRFRLDDRKPQRATVHTVILGNCGSLPSNILLLPDAVVDDGLFDLLLMRPGGALGWLRVWWKVAWINGIVRRTAAGRTIAGERRNDADLHYETGTHFTARLSRPENIELDGDAFGEATAFRAWIEPAALTIRVPTTAATE